MSETTFTPGPWKLSRNKKQNRMNVSGHQWANLAQVVVRMRYGETDLHKGVANAHLIAAAPDLFDALRAILLDFDDCSGAEPSLSVLHRSIDTIGRAALKRALGDQ